MSDRATGAPIGDPTMAPSPRSSRRHHVMLHIAILAFGASSLFAKMIDLAPGPLVLARAGVAAAVIAGVAKVSRRSVGPRKPAHLALFAVLGAVLGLHWMAFFQAVQVSTVSIAVLSFATFPIFTTLVDAVATRRRPRSIDLALGLLAFAGVTIIVGTPDPQSSVTLGVFWGVVASATFAGLAVVNERLVVNYPGLSIALYQFGFAALVLAPFFTGGLRGLSTTDLLLLLLLGTVFTGLPHTLFMTSMQAISVSAASLTVSLEPVYAVLLAWLILDERPGLGVVIGGAVILTAVGLGTRYRR